MSVRQYLSPESSEYRTALVATMPIAYLGFLSMALLGITELDRGWPFLLSYVPMAVLLGIGVVHLLKK